MAEFLLTSSLTMADIDRFLSLSLVRTSVFMVRLQDPDDIYNKIKRLGLSFLTTLKLCGLADILPKMPPWKCCVIDTSPHQTKSSIRLFYRNTMECLEILLSNPLCGNSIDFSPYCVFTNAQHFVQVYTEWMSSNHAWQLQVSSLHIKSILSSNHIFYRTSSPQGHAYSGSSSCWTQWMWPINLVAKSCTCSSCHWQISTQQSVAKPLCMHSSPLPSLSIVTSKWKAYFRTNYITNLWTLLWNHWRSQLRSGWCCPTHLGIVVIALCRWLAASSTPLKCVWLHAFKEKHHQWHLWTKPHSATISTILSKQKPSHSLISDPSPLIQIICPLFSMLVWSTTSMGFTLHFGEIGCFPRCLNAFLLKFLICFIAHDMITTLFGASRLLVLMKLTFASQFFNRSQVIITLALA